MHILSVQKKYMVRSIMALLRKWYWNLTNTAIEHFSCRFLPLIYLLPEAWNIWQGWRGMNILVSFHHANACCSDGRWFSARVGVMMVTQYLSHIWGGWTSEGLWEHNQVHNLEDQIAIHLNFGIIKLQTQVYKTPGSPISLSWSATSASCVSLYIITYSLAVAQHNILPRAVLRTSLWLQKSSFISILCIRNACLKIICNINIKPNSIRTCSRNRRPNGSCFIKSRCQVDLKRSAPDWPKAFWCTYWGPNMEPRVCTMKQVVCEAVYGLWPMGFSQNNAPQKSNGWTSPSIQLAMFSINSPIWVTPIWPISLVMHPIAYNKYI